MAFDLPPWASEMCELFKSGSVAQFLLHGNIFDLVPTSPERSSSLKSFLNEIMFAAYDVILHYDRGKGIRPGKGAEDWADWLEQFAGSEARTLAAVREPGKALELILLAKKLTAAEAQAFGLVNQVVPEGKVMAHAMTWANKLNEAGPIAIKQAKTAVRQGLERSLEHALQFEIECYKACLYSKDRIEGLKAFAEKRKPVYRGE